MADEVKKEIKLEIGHVLFMDIVGYSKLLMNEQRAAREKLNQIVRSTETFREADATGTLIKSPSGDGMALVFRESPEQPVECALEVNRALHSHPELPLRMGVHSGPVSAVTDVNDTTSVAGAGINMAQRVMDCGDAGHILLSRRVAEDLAQDAKWQLHLHDLGETEVKHLQKIGIVNLYTDEIGNRNLPIKIRQEQQQMHRRRNMMLAAAAVVIVAAIVGFFALPRASADKIEKSIAVLPFGNLSDDKENAYFADGIQDDVLTNLSKIGDLKVISRTSVMEYKEKPKNVRQIGKALGVSNILEGSVRRSGNKVRVNVQLIDALTDKHVWANEYDRDLTDVFAIQSELARDIANQLKAKLSDAEEARIETKPTENGDAYLAFVQAQNLSDSYEDFDKLKQGEQFYERAIELDPQFALAIARYSQLQSWIVHTFERTPERREKARTLAERALRLQPDLSEAHLARGFSYYYGDADYDAALREFQAAQRGLPNEYEAYLAVGAIQRRQGKWQESTANLEKAASLNPRDTWPLQNLVFNYQMVRDFDAANKTVDRALKIDPKSFPLWEIKAKLAISERGDLSVGQQCLEKAQSMPPKSNEGKLKLFGGKVEFLLLQRKYKEVLKVGENFPDNLFSSVPGSVALKYFAIGIAQKRLGDDAKARAAFERAKEILKEQLPKKGEEAELHIQLAKLHAWLGEKEAALAEAQRATELRPETKDAFEGPQVTAQVAEVHAILGDTDRAIEILDGLMNRPSDLTLATLKLNPAWDPLRSSPRFQALLTKYGGKD